MAFKIVVANKIHDSVRAQLEPHGHLIVNESEAPWKREELLEHCKSANAVMAFMTETLGDDFLAQCPDLKIIAGALKGYNNIDVDACSARDILLTIVPDLLTEPTAELTVGLMISVARNFVPGDQYIRAGRFNGWRPKFYGGTIQGSTVAVLGAGAVGQAILKMLSGFDCEKLYVDKNALGADVEMTFGTRKVQLDEALRSSDFIVLALHLTPDTLHMVDDAFLSQMKAGSYLINPARGSLVDEDAVAHALQDNHLAGYAADTFEMEDWAIETRPRAINHSLLRSDKTVFTPHIGSAVRRVREQIELSAANSIITVAKGHIPDTAVNRSTLKMVG